VRLLRPIFAACVTVGCYSAKPDVRPPYLPRVVDSRDLDRASLPNQRPFPEVASALQIADLTVSRLPPGYHELRLTRSVDMIAGVRIPMLRLMYGPEGVVGEVIVYRVIPDSLQVDRETGCVPVRAEFKLCATRIRKPLLDWTVLNMQLDSLGAWTLSERCEDDSQRLWRVFDAGDLLIQRLRGSEFEAYSCNAPGRRTATDAGRRAAAIYEFLSKATLPHRR
jgi:hypothetical protein